MASQQSGVAAVGAAVYPALDQRPIKKHDMPVRRRRAIDTGSTGVFFLVMSWTVLIQQSVSPQMLEILSKLRHKVAIGFVGGSDLVKQQQQLGAADVPVTSLFDFCFSENGLTAFRLGVPLASASFIEWLGEEKYKRFVKFVLHYIADLDIPIKRGTFVEFRNGLVNISPIGRNASTKERNEYQEYDLKHGIRAKFVDELKKNFPDLGLIYSIGGQISFDCFPKGWDKTYCLQHVENEKNLPGGVDYTTIHFFGDKTSEGGNDYELFSDARTIGHTVLNPDETMAELQKMFDL